MRALHHMMHDGNRWFNTFLSSNSLYLEGLIMSDVLFIAGEIGEPALTGKITMRVPGYGARADHGLGPVDVPMPSRVAGGPTRSMIGSLPEKVAFRCKQERDVKEQLWVPLNRLNSSGKVRSKDLQIHGETYCTRLYRGDSALPESDSLFLLPQCQATNFPNKSRRVRNRI